MILSFIEIIWEPSDHLPDLCGWHCECQRRWCRYQTGHHQRAAPLHPPPPKTDLMQINTQTHTQKLKNVNFMSLSKMNFAFRPLFWWAVLLAARKLVTVLYQHFYFVIPQQLSCTLLGSCMVAQTSHTVIINFLCICASSLGTRECDFQECLERWVNVCTNFIYIHE